MDSGLMAGRQMRLQSANMSHNNYLLTENEVPLYCTEMTSKYFINSRVRRGETKALFPD